MQFINKSMAVYVLEMSTNLYLGNHAALPTYCTRYSLHTYSSHNQSSYSIHEFLQAGMVHWPDYPYAHGIWNHREPK